MSSPEASAQVGVPFADIEELTLCAGYALGTCSLACRPLWVAALIKAGSLSTLQVGLLASGEAFAMAIGVLVVSSLGKHGNLHWMAKSAALIAVISNVTAMYSTVHTVVMGRLLSGLAAGTLVALVTRAAACRQKPQKTLAVMQAAAVLVVSIVYFGSAGVIDRFGPPGFFGILSGLSIAVAAAVFIAPPTVYTTRTATARAGFVKRLGPIVGCVALLVVFIGQSTVGTYIITIGSAAGFDGGTLGTVLALSLPVSLLGPVSARLLGERAGLLRPLLFGLLLLAVSIVALVETASLVIFSMSAAALGLFVEFCLPYSVALLSRLDRMGRAASAAPACMIVGLAIGPTLGARVASGATGFGTLAVVSASCVVAGLLLFAAAAGLADLESTEQPTRPQDL